MRDFISMKVHARFKTPVVWRCESVGHLPSGHLGGWLNSLVFLDGGSWPNNSDQAAQKGLHGIAHSKKCALKAPQVPKGT